ncbi:MAG: hypothetical protein U5J63_08970 [Fodinibius sp.]|nr:hypothetical protein [Fodinibius sp.]
MSRLDEIKGIITGIEDDMVKFYEKGNKAAGTRARKGLQNLKKLSQEVRLEIQDIKGRRYNCLIFSFEKPLYSGFFCIYFFELIFLVTL